MLTTILTIVIILLIIGALPVWPHSRQFGYYPSGFSGIFLIVFIILLFKGVI
jgi:hypothetical protein